MSNRPRAVAPRALLPLLLLTLLLTGCSAATSPEADPDATSETASDTDVTEGATDESAEDPADDPATEPTEANATEDELEAAPSTDDEFTDNLDIEVRDVDMCAWLDTALAAAPLTVHLNQAGFAPIDGADFDYVVTSSDTDASVTCEINATDPTDGDVVPALHATLAHGPAAVLPDFSTLPAEYQYTYDDLDGELNAIGDLRLRLADYTSLTLELSPSADDLEMVASNRTGTVAPLARSLVDAWQDGALSARSSGPGETDTYDVAKLCDLIDTATVAEIAGEPADSPILVTAESRLANANGDVTTCTYEPTTATVNAVGVTVLLTQVANADEAAVIFDRYVQSAAQAGSTCPSTKTLVVYCDTDESSDAIAQGDNWIVKASAGLSGTQGVDTDALGVFAADAVDAVADWRFMLAG